MPAFPVSQFTALTGAGVDTAADSMLIVDASAGAAGAKKITVAELAAALGPIIETDSANSSFAPSGTGASSRTAQAKMRDTVSVLDFGATGDGTTDDTAAIQAADTAAAAANKVLRFPGPSSKYIYKPTASYTILADWEGDGPADTQIEVDTSSYTGAYLIHASGGRKMSGLDIKCKADAKVGYGLQIKVASNFVSYLKLERVWVRGFDRNVDCDQSYALVTEQCRFESGNEGWYCAPTGYITTHQHISSTFYGNARNIYYAPTVNSDIVQFRGCINENATGAAEQAHFENVRQLKLDAFYCEGASTIPAIEFGACRVSIDGLYLNGTGGVTTGASNVTLAMKGVLTTSATDVLTIAASGNTVEAVLENCSLQGSGNDISGIDRGAIINSSINGTSYDFYAIGSSGKVALKFPATAVDDSNANTLDDYEEGTFTPTIAGVSAAGTNTYTGQTGYYTKIGNRVFINGEVILSAKGTAGNAMSGNIYIGGLPFTAGNASLNRSALALANWQNIDLAAAGNVLTAYIELNTTRAMLLECTDNGASASITDADIADTTRLCFSGHYRV